jgi:FkbM family methyltransferase
MYSQNSEELIIATYFKDFVGTFLDLGANDGVTLSNTYALYKKGWDGTVVEASPRAFQRLPYAVVNKGNGGIYCNMVCINSAIGSFNGEITLHESGEHLGNGDVALLSSTKQNEVNRWGSTTGFTDIEVPCINFNTLLGMTHHKTFDFISIDIEGMELEVLPQMDLQALGCKLLCVEFNGKEQEKYDAIVLPQVFKLIHKNAENLIYAKS